MRSRAPLAVVFFFSLSSVPLFAGIDDKPVDMQTIQALEARANLAQPREQCFLYAEVVHQLTELSLRQYATADVGQTTDMMKHIQQMAQKIHLSMAENDKRLKGVERLLSHTAFRLNELLHGSSFEDRELVEKTLNDVNHAQNEALLQVLRK